MDFIHRDYHDIVQNAEVLGRVKGRDRLLVKSSITLN